MINRILIALILGGSLTGCETWKRAYVDVHDSVDEVLADKTNVTPPVVTDPVPVPSGEAQTLWPAIECNWMIHGTENENQIREQAIREASASGKAIRFRFRDGGTDLRFWLLWWESDVDRGKFPASHMWAPKALAAGVKRWVVSADGANAALVIDTFKAYGDADHQLQVVNPTKEVTAGLGLDAQGIKTTPPRKR
jgi:hypothetical protein